MRSPFEFESYIPVASDPYLANRPIAQNDFAHGPHHLAHSFSTLHVIHVIIGVTSSCSNCKSLDR